MTKDKLILAVPKGRILQEFLPVLARCDIIPEPEFTNERSRKIRFSSNQPDLDIIQVRSFDVATFVAYGGADFGIAGSDVLAEYDYDDIYAPLDLKIGKCRLSVAVPVDEEINLHTASHIRVATKYPELTARYFAGQGVQAECIKLNGAMEIAPALELSKIIVDLVSTGSTLKANGLREAGTIMDVSSKLIVNRSAFKTQNGAIAVYMNKFKEAVS